MLSRMRSIGPITMPTGYRKFVLERGRDSADAGFRQYVIDERRRDLEAKPWMIQHQDEIACNYLCMSARLYEEGRRKKSHRASFMVLKETAVLAARPDQAPGLMHRVHVLRSAVWLNRTIAHLEADHLLAAEEALTEALDHAELVRAENREDPVFATLTPFLMDVFGQVTQLDDKYPHEVSFPLAAAKLRK